MRITWKAIVKWLVAVAIISYLGQTLLGQLHVLRQHEWNVRADQMAIALGLAIVTLALFVRIWHELLGELGATVLYRTAFRIWFISAFLRYLPGKVIGVLSMVYLCEREGIPKVVSITSGVLNQGFSILSGLTLGALFLWIHPYDGLPSETLWMAIALVLIILLFFPVLMDRVIGSLLKRSGWATISWRIGFKTFIYFYGSYFMVWILFGLGFFFVIRSLTNLSVFYIPHMISIFIVSYLVGFLSMITPGGLGVREGLLAALLTPYVSMPVAIMVAFIARLWLTAAELLCVIMASKIGSSGKGVGDPSSTEEDSANPPFTKEGRGDLRRRTSVFSRKRLGLMTLMMLVTVGFAALYPVWASSEPPAQRMNLEQTVERALDQDPMTWMRLQDVSKARAKVQELKSVRQPDVNLKLEYGYFDNPNLLGEDLGSLTGFTRGHAYTAGVNIDSHLFDWKKNTTQIDISNDEVKIREWDVRIAQLNLMYLVTNLYYTVLLNKKILESSQNSLKIAELHLQQAEELLKVGKTTRFEVLRSQVAVANGTTSKINKEQEFNTSIQALRTILNIPREVRLELLGDLTYQAKDYVYEELVSTALQDHPNLQKMRISQKINHGMIEVEKYGQMPELSLFTYYSYKDVVGTLEDNYDSYTVGLALDFPLFKSGITRNRTIQAQHELLKGALAMADFKEDLKLSINRLLESLSYGKQVIETQGPNIHLARENVQVAEFSYESGRGTGLDLADAKAALITAETEYYQALFNYTITLVELARLIGKDPRNMIAH